MTWQPSDNRSIYQMVWKQDGRHHSLSGHHHYKQSSNNRTAKQDRFIINEVFLFFLKQSSLMSEQPSVNWPGYPMV
jgi:hypothetical protein